MISHPDVRVYIWDGTSQKLQCLIRAWSSVLWLSPVFLAPEARVNLWWNSSHTEGPKLTETFSWIWKSREATGGAAGGKSAKSEVYWSAPHSPESETSKCVVVWKLPFFFFAYWEQLLPEDKPAWSFPQEISKCLCLERQVAGTHSKASSASRTTENRASPSEKFLEA